MKVYAIRDNSIDKNRDLAYLFYYEKTRRFFIEICDDTDEWEAPLILSSFVARGKRSLDSHWSRLWVDQRIIPPDRQNLGMILKANGLNEYDPFQLLLLGKGRCAQDDCYLVPLSASHFPFALQTRMRQLLTEALPLEDSLLCFFRDGTIRSVSQQELSFSARQFQRLYAYRQALTDMHVQSGGHMLQLTDGSSFPATELRTLGTSLPFSAETVLTHMRNTIFDTREAAAFLHCSRQNIQDLVRRKKLTPLKKTSGQFLFLKSELKRYAAG